MRNIYFFGAPWCVNCKRLKPHADKFFEDIIFIDIDQSPEFISMYDIKTIPLLIVEQVEDNLGTVVARLVNPTPPQLAQTIEMFKD